MIKSSSFRISEVRKLCLMEDQEKCTMQSVLNVEKNAKYHSNPTKTDLYTVENVMPKRDHLEEIDTKL